MKEFDKIPVTKVQRASKFIATGAKIGGNYLKHYGKKLIHGEQGKELHDEGCLRVNAVVSGGLLRRGALRNSVGERERREPDDE